MNCSCRSVRTVEIWKIRDSTLRLFRPRSPIFSGRMAPRPQASGPATGRAWRTSSSEGAGPGRVEGALMNLGNKKPVMASFAGNARPHAWKRRSPRLSLPQKHCHKNKLGRPTPESVQKTLTRQRPAPRPPVRQAGKEQVRARVPHASQPKRHKGTLSAEIGCGREPHDSLAKYSMVNEGML